MTVLAHIRKTGLILFILIFFILLLIGFNITLNNVAARAFISTLFEPRPGKCLILAERYCRKIQLIPDPRSNGDFLAVARIPKGAAVFSPGNGVLSSTPVFIFPNSPESRYPGVLIEERDANDNPTNTLYALTLFNEGRAFEFNNAQKGQIIAKLSQKKIEALGDFNLVFGVFEVSADSSNKVITTSDSNLLKEIINSKENNEK